jgi:ADP-L-glycero-D-manno-heptose 6-epimerase
MKVMITGHKGFIGQNYCKAAEKLGWQITMFDIQDKPDARPNDLMIDDCDWVIHLGAVSSTTETDIKKVIDLNVSWSIELFEKCIDENVNFQWASSASVYGKNRTTPMKIEDECYPANLYAKSKYLFEQYVKASVNIPIKAQGFRYFNVYGPHEDHKGTQASPYYQFAKQAKETGMIKVFEGSENYYRDFVHVDELIEKQIYTMDNLSGIYNIGSGNARSFMNIARDVALLYNAEIVKIPFPESLKSHYQKYTCAG